METLSDRLKAALAASGKTKTDLWKACGLSSGAVSHWFNGNTKKLEGENLLCAARVLGVNPEWLATGKGSLTITTKYAPTESQLQEVPLMGRVPLVSYVAAGNWSEAVDNYIIEDGETWIATTVAVKQHTYALRVEGESMEPRFPSGAIIIVEPEEEAKNGSFVIVRQNGSEATFKQLIYDGGQAYLKPLNPRYPIMQMQPDAVICGVVKQMVMDV